MYDPRVCAGQAQVRSLGQSANLALTISTVATVGELHTRSSFLSCAPGLSRPIAAKRLSLLMCTANGGVLTCGACGAVASFTAAPDAVLSRRQGCRRRWWPRRRRRSGGRCRAVPPPPPRHCCSMWASARGPSPPYCGSWRWVPPGIGRGDWMPTLLCAVQASHTGTLVAVHHRLDGRRRHQRLHSRIGISAAECRLIQHSSAARRSACGTQAWPPGSMQRCGCCTGLACCSYGAVLPSSTG